MNKDNFSHIVEVADDILLRKSVLQWAQEHEDFRAFLFQKLCSTHLEVDFGEVLQAIVRQNVLSDSPRLGARKYVDWRAVLITAIQPYAKQAETLSTDKLQKLVEAILTEVVMQVTEDDFIGDDWYGDDFTHELFEIIGYWADMTGVLLLRPDIASPHIQSLRKLIEEVARHHVISTHISTSLQQLTELIDIRLKAGKFTEPSYDLMAQVVTHSKAGEWICRKIDYLRALGKEEEAEKCGNQNFQFPEVALKCIRELIAEGKIERAKELIEKAQAINRRNLWEPPP